MGYTPQQGVFDQNYINYLNSLQQGDLSNIAGQGGIYGGVPTDWATLQNFKSTMGRDPTAAEFGMYGPMGAQAGQAISQQRYNADNAPDKIAAQNQAQYLKNAPQHYDTINNLFKSNYGRDATQDEKDHFGALLASGTTDAYGLQNFLQQQPEYQNQQNAKMRSDLSGTMAANDKRQFQEQILPGIQENFAKQGRSFDSSAFANSAAQAAQAQNTNREAFLRNLTAQQYGQSSDRAYQDYANQVANQQALTNSGINAQYGGIQNTINRGNQIADFRMQQDAYNQYLSKYGKRQNNGIGSLLGGIGGAAIGGAATGWHNPQGYMAGYQIGSGIGGAGQSASSGGNW